MESLYILIPIALVIVSVAVLIFVWAVKSGQFEDLDTQGKRILFDETRKPDVPKSNSKNSKSEASEGK